ncbi:MAG TPA: Ig-like domain repeat protein [Jatrophihabitans sp.]|jgi:hypothetical protein|uniref:Ig-like domain repeat protein n=1 Tax=Jatrophihabitans sp. TaxID=1932789 RepID=UPI002E09B5EF|nr:Ig-like domain repeat protein [Jatrophihabitans sp.]
MRTLTSKRAGVAALATIATSAAMLTLGAGAANAATTPPWEPDASSVGTLSFYDASGNQITSGSTLAAPFAAYVAGSVPVRAGDTSAALYFANPTTADPTTWYRILVGNVTPYPVTSGPASIQTLSQSKPVNTGSSGDLDLSDFEGLVTPTTVAGYQNVVQVRMRTANTANQLGVPYDVADVSVDPATNTWTQIYPTPLTATSTTLTAAPSPATSGQQVTLTATETPKTAGSVQFKDGTTNLGSAVAVTATTGVATTQTSSLTTGSHSLSAVFTPTDTSFAASTGTATLVVNPPATATSTTLAVNQDGVAGDAATLTATVTGPGSTPNNAGTVSFYDNGASTALNASPVPGSSGVYTLGLPTGFAAGGHSVVAKFTPTDNTVYAASQSAAQSFLTQAPLQGACAQTGSACTSTSNVQATVPVGTLVIATPYTSAHPLDLGTLALDAGATRFTGSATFDSIVVTDTRSGGLGYTVSALASALSDGKGNAGSTINAQNLGLTTLHATPGNAFVGTVTPTDNPAANAVTPGDTGSLGLGGPTPHTVFSVDKGLGTVSVKGTVTLNAPTSTEAGTFGGTITFTVG